MQSVTPCGSGSAIPKTATRKLSLHACGVANRCARQHAHLLRLERRLDTREHTHDLPSLARLPSQIKTYAFCLRRC